MPIKMIKIGEEIPDIEYCIKSDACNIIKKTRNEFKNKKIIIFSVPGAFVSDYPASMLYGYESNYDQFKELGIDDIYCTGTHDYFVFNNWFKSEEIKNVKCFPDGNSEWAKKTGFLVDMRSSFMGNRSHRYAMIIDNNKIKKVFYEDLTHDPHTCFLVSYAENIIKYLKNIKGTWEDFQA